MNKKIRELALKTDEACENLGRSDIGEEWVETFAKLVVKECAEICAHQRDPSNLNYKPSERMSAAIKQAFGVQ